MKAPGGAGSGLQFFRVAGEVQDIRNEPTCATSKIGAVGSVLIATIRLASFIPRRAAWPADPACDVELRSDRFPTLSHLTRFWEPVHVRERPRCADRRLRSPSRTLR